MPTFETITLPQQITIIEEARDVQAVCLAVFTLDGGEKGTAKVYRADGRYVVLFDSNGYHNGLSCREPQFVKDGPEGFRVAANAVGWHLYAV